MASAKKRVQELFDRMDLTVNPEMGIWSRQYHEVESYVEESPRLVVKAFTELFGAPELLLQWDKTVRYVFTIRDDGKPTCEVLVDQYHDEGVYICFIDLEAGFHVNRAQYVDNECECDYE